MYLYSLVVLVLLAVILPHVRKQTPFEMLSLAWLYALDTVINAAYTTAFALTWFATSSALERHPDPTGDGPVPENPGVPDATLAEGVPVTPDVPKTTKHIGPEESWTSLALIVVVTVVRVYFTLVIMSFAREVLSSAAGRRRDAGWEPESRGNGDASAGSKQELFARGTPEGEGWRGRAGRSMLKRGKGYWLGDRAQDEWVKNANSKMRNDALA